MINNFDPWVLSRTPLAEKHLLPPSAGLYFVFESDELLYVGKTEKGFNTRLANHHRNDEFIKKKNVAIACWEREERGNALLILEESAIKAFKPSLNGKSTNVVANKGIKLQLLSLYVLHSDLVKTQTAKKIVQSFLCDCFQDETMLKHLMVVVAAKADLSGIEPSEAFTQLLADSEYKTTKELCAAWGLEVEALEGEVQV